MIGFSSVSHMGLVMLGLSTLNQNGLTGAGVQMFSHGIMTALFFAVTGMIYDRSHTRQIPELGGNEQSHAVRRDWFHYRWFGFDGHAWLLRFRCGVSDFPRRLAIAMAGGCDRKHFHCRHSGIHPD